MGKDFKLLYIYVHTLRYINKTDIENSVLVNQKINIFQFLLSIVIARFFRCSSQKNISCRNFIMTKNLE